MVGDFGGRSQPADTTIAGGVHMVVSVSGQYARCGRPKPDLPPDHLYALIANAGAVRCSRTASKQSRDSRCRADDSKHAMRHDNRRRTSTAAACGSWQALDSAGQWLLRPSQISAFDARRPDHRELTRSTADRVTRSRDRGLEDALWPADPTLGGNLSTRSRYIT
jgi:hypothetical protein